jgi:hypothetical protein
MKSRIALAFALAAAISVGFQRSHQATITVTQEPGLTQTSTAETSTIAGWLLHR